MEIIRGKSASFIDLRTLSAQLTGYTKVHIDLGTGDGRFVKHIAQTRPDSFVIGIDACRENLHEVSRRSLPNILFVIANARLLPPELIGLAAHISINFPWGSLLEGLLTDDAALLSGLAMILRPNAAVEVRLNGGALAEFGWSLEDGSRQVRDVLALNGLSMQPPVTLRSHDLKSIPTTWAKRLTFGRDPRAVYLHGAAQQIIMAESQLEHSYR